MSPMAPAHPCTWPGCSQLVRGASRCERHRRQEQRDYNARRGSSAKQGYGKRWQAAREEFLSGHPSCQMCSKPGHPVMATVVDHIQPHRGDQKLFWERSNWQALCKSCHDRKTARQDGRWG